MVEKERLIVGEKDGATVEGDSVVISVDFIDGTVVVDCTFMKSFDLKLNIKGTWFVLQLSLIYISYI